MNITPPLKWHGGKTYLASRIVALMPPHTHYVEPFAGGLAVLLAKDPEGVSEVINDRNWLLTNFWKHLQRPDLFTALQRRLEAIPCSEVEFSTAKEFIQVGDCSNSLDAAVAFFIVCRQSMAARMKTFTPLAKTRTRRGMNELPSAWLTAIEGLPAVHQRIKRVVILNRDALEVIRQQDGPRGQTLFYLDPPYVPESRSTPDVYAHEMTIEQHADLLDLIRSLNGKVMISGYDCDLYRQKLSDWTRHEFDLANHAAGAGGGQSKRRMTEVLWCNF